MRYKVYGKSSGPDDKLSQVSAPLTLRRGISLISNVTFLQVHKFCRYISLSNTLWFTCVGVHPGTKYRSRFRSLEQAKRSHSVGIVVLKSLSGTRDYVAEVPGMMHNTGERLERTYGKLRNKYSGFSISHSMARILTKKKRTYISLPRFRDFHAEN